MHTTMSQNRNPKMQRPARRSLGYGSDTRPESPLARPSSPHLSGTHGVTSGKQAWLSPVTDPSSHHRHVHAPRTGSPKPTRKISSTSSSAVRLNKTYPCGRFSDIEYSSGESDSRSGYDSYDNASHNNARRDRSPRYYPTHDNDYSVGGNHSPAIVYHDEDYSYGGSQTGSGYFYDRPDVYHWNSTPPVDQSGGHSPRYSTPVYAYSEDLDRTVDVARETKKAVSAITCYY
ncbi:uncharacterized protein LOC119735288 [Patiria miniata]|uniref:Uncharacterized protein n=1 Tax=Patiria miniata TaxID=46514 RepID=A0A914ALM7_PATMI|nr:uncharacterized protein LOC119735288 [Patiria miniata]